jgi:hypothetical protein
MSTRPNCFGNRWLPQKDVVRIAPEAQAIFSRRRTSREGHRSPRSDPVKPALVHTSSFQIVECRVFLLGVGP